MSYNSKIADLGPGSKIADLIAKASSPLMVTTSTTRITQKNANMWFSEEETEAAIKELESNKLVSDTLAEIMNEL